METKKIDLKNFEPNILTAKLLCYLNNTKRTDWLDRATADLIESAKVFAEENFVINEDYPVGKIANNLVLFLYGSELSAFTKFVDNTEQL